MVEIWALSKAQLWTAEELEDAMELQNRYISVVMRSILPK
jgi:hypothetical protein